VSLSFVNKLLKRQRTSGSLATLPHQDSPPTLLSNVARTQLAACVVRQPDATLDELRVHPAASGGPVVGCAMVWQGLQTLDLRRKKRALTPPSTTPNV
jgi:transposase